MKHTIVRIVDKEECYNTVGEAVPFLAFKDKYTKGKKVSFHEVTLEQLVELCDHDAENVNAHDFCGSHRLLAALLCRSIGRALATEIFFEIATRRGLHGMGGVCVDGDAYRELKVGRAGYDWSGRFGE